VSGDSDGDCDLEWWWKWSLWWWWLTEKWWWCRWCNDDESYSTKYI